MANEHQKPMPELIHHSFQNAARQLPAYEQILPFFESVYTLQEAALSTTWPDTITLTPEILKAKLEGDFPLVDRQEAPMDHAAAVRLLEAIVAESDKATPTLRDASHIIKAALESNTEIIERGFHLVLSGNANGLAQLGEQIGIDIEVLHFFFYNSLFPSVAQHERLLSAQHDITPHKDRRQCPICGGAPSLSFLSENGARFLICSFCRHQWSIKRILCPHCGSGETESITYFFVEEEKAYRVYTCDGCKTYIKTVDVRELARPFYPPLENIITTHLDMQAQQMGFQSIAACRLPA